MTKSEAKKRIAKLKKVINHHRYLYHVLDTQEITDAALDSLKNELVDLEKQFPEFITPDSPTQRVGGEPLDKFKKVEHKTPMLSIDDVFVVKDIEDWEKYLNRLAPGEKLEYFCELKIDGFAISLMYKDGILVRAATRGNGKIGEDVTQNIKTVESIPLRLEEYKKTNQGDIEVRGEVYMDKKTFERVNRDQREKGEKEYANPRNLAAGSVRQLDPKLTALRKLKFLAYDIVGDIGQTKHSEEHAIARSLGFNTDKFSKICDNLEEVFELWQKVSKERDNLLYNIDGIVISVNNNALFDKLGVAGKSPRGIRAFKFAPKQATTIIEDVKVHVGRTGAVTPIAHLKPVEISGVTISRATLHNQDEIDRLDVRIGDTVIVGRAGDVIPDIIEVVKELRAGREKKFKMPANCPVCGDNLARMDTDVILRCTNKNCPARSREYLYFFVSKKAFNIDGLGPKIVDQLVENGLVYLAHDLFDLKEGDLLLIKRFKEKSSSNIVSAIERSKKIPLARFIYALGIRHVGEETAIDLAQYFGGIDNIKKASVEDFKNIPDIGEIVAKELHSWFKSRSNIDFIDKILGKGIVVVKPEKQGAKLRGRTFVFTGTLEKLTRQEGERKVRMLGGNASSSVSSETDYVVSGKNPGSKHDKAKKLGIKILSEEEFLKMIS